jgi:hypothetical protein
MKIGGQGFFQRYVLPAVAGILAAVLTACTGRGGGQLSRQLGFCLSPSARRLAVAKHRLGSGSHSLRTDAAIGGGTMDTREHRRKPWAGRSFARPAVRLVMTLVSALLATGSSYAVAGTSTDGQRVDVTINIAALPLDNLCNGDVVNLSGDMRIVTVTRPTKNGGYTVTSTATARNLRGNRIAPLPAIPYTGDQTDDSFSYYAPPPYPSTSRIAHWTKLVPQGKAPTMWLVVVSRYTIAADGTLVPVAERAYLTCSQPSDHRCD